MTGREAMDPVLVAEAAVELAVVKVNVERLVAHFRESAAAGEDMTWVISNTAVVLTEELRGRELGPAAYAAVAISMLAALAEAGERS